MYKLVAVIIVLLAVASTEHAANAVAEGPEAVEQWFKNLLNATVKPVKLTKIQFYFHDILFSLSPSAVEIAHSNFRLPFQTDFGTTRMMDNPLTEGPKLDSKLIGQAKGIYGYASKEEPGLLMTHNLVFTDGKHKGNSLSVLGHNPLQQKYREIPIVGGTGAFRLAGGIATVQTVSFDNITEHTVFKYDVFVLHYGSIGYKLSIPITSS